MNGIWPVDDLVALADDAHDLRPHLLQADAERLEHPRRKALLLAEQPEQDVLGADVVVPERPRLVLSQDNHLPGTFGKPLKHQNGG